MPRPSFLVLVTLTACLALPLSGFAQTDTQTETSQPAIPLNLDTLVAAFDALSTDDRSAVQEEMQTGGFYDGPLDGSDSDATRQGLQMTVDQVFSNGYEGPAMDLTTPAGAKAFIAAIVSGDMSKWIYGEGEEMDG